METARGAIPLPYAILALLLALWIGLGIWICFAAPYGSGTDESIRHVAFTAATNRWPSREDATARGIDSFYYPPLYFLLFAPFFGDEPSFTTAYPLSADRYFGLMLHAGGNQLVSGSELRRVTPELLRLYRTAKLVSLVFGAGIVACVVGSLRLIFPGRDRPWLVLGGTAPLLLLPQFLYYHTLVNNDTLVNLLCALATLCFIAAVRRAAGGDAAGSRNSSILCAAAVGLGLLTKQSAIVLAPLLPALAFFNTRSGEPPGTSRRLASGFRRLLLLSTVSFAAGGWWLLRSGLADDPSGMSAQKLTHSWAFSHTDFSWVFLSRVVGASFRSSIALFAGATISIPDKVFVLYLAVAAALGAAFVASVLVRRFRRPAGASPAPAPRLVWTMLGATFFVNLGLLVFYNLDIIAPHGRLLFPSLTTASAFLALALRTIAGRCRRLLATLVCLLAVCLGGLFLWVFQQRMVAAVTQPDEHLVPLGVKLDGSISTNPLWTVSLQQPLLLPPGRLTGLRFLTGRSSFLPQLGTVVHARLRLVDGSAGFSEHRFLPSSVGDNRPSGWTDIVLEEPLELRSPRIGLLLLQATKPSFTFPGVEFGYLLITPENSPLLKPVTINGVPSDRCMAITAVYR